MQNDTRVPPKPRSERYRPELTRLPDLAPARLAYRRKAAARCAWFIRTFTKAEFHGLEHFPDRGPGLIVTNHLGDADLVLGLAGLPTQPDGLAKAELYDHPLVGRWLQQYGTIWVHRGMADRKAIRSAIDGLSQGRFVSIAPEARQSVTGALEEATSGAAFIALRAGAPIIPVTFTGTEDSNVYSNLRRLRKPEMSLTVGPPFHLDPHPDRAEALRLGTEKIMRRLAAQLPPRYRGHYAGVADG